MSSQRSRSPSPDTETVTLPWGCLITVELRTHWPLDTTVEHHKATCRCFSEGGNEAIMRRYLFICAYEFYYKASPKRYNSLVCMEMIKTQADRLGLDLGDLDIWDPYPHVLPPRP
ncbi:hypothetical protein F5B21DRAFT_469283 [Xylaria acuta]|nr:hypothetical protein F5B21DRAFT_469283 [Xylaria acuta]